MPGKSNSFHQVTPFIPKTGLLGYSYIAFPLDIVKLVPPTPPVPPPEAPIFEQYDGPFEGIRFLTQEIEGDNRSIFSFAFLGVDHSHEAGLVPLQSTTAGLAYTQWSGSSTFDPGTSTYSGPGLTVVSNEAGTIPAGVNFYKPAGQPLTFTANTFDELLLALNGGPGYAIPSRSYSEGTRANGTFVRKWYSETPGPSTGGYFAGYTMARIWSDGWTVTLTYSDLTTPEQLGIPIARTGVPAMCQHVTGYNAETFTYVGTKSRVRQNVAIPAGKTKLYGDFKYLVTPDNGDLPYYYYDSQEYDDIVGGETYNAVTWFPWIVDAVVCYVSGDFSFTPSYYLGYGSASNGVEYTQLPDNSTWPETVDYMMPTPNAEAWDDFRDYGGADTNTSQYLLNLFTGYGWEEDWFFMGVDPIDCYDDFNAYSDGEIPNLTQGSGWAEPGFFFLVPPWDVNDDFQSYADGPITSWNVAGDFWAEDGFFV